MSSFFHRTPLYDHAVATVDGFVYASAGSVEGKASLLLQEKVQCYNPHINDWDFVTPMQEARAKAAAAEHEGLLYVTSKEGVDSFRTEVIWVLTQSQQLHLGKKERCVTSVAWQPLRCVIT